MMKHRTFALFLALGLSLSLLSGCGPKESGSTSQPGGSTSSSQGSPDASQPDVSLPDASAPDTSAPGESAPEAPQPPVDEPEAVAALALDKSDFSLFKAGSSYQLKATVSGVDAPKVTWTSSDETVAAVSQDGTVTAVARGTATITAAVEGTELRASCTVRCKLPEDQPVSGGGNSSSQGSGNGGSSSQAPAADQADLSAFYTTESGKYEFGMITLADAELAANVYPGLFDIASEQCLPYINMMTMNTSEIVLVQVTNSSDVDKVKSILQSRIDAQVEGGAWYPSAIDAWQNNSRIVSNGNYIMMVVHESCDSIVSDFNALF